MILLLLLILLMPVPASAMQMIGFGASSCASQSFDVQFTTKTDTVVSWDSDQRGQSWTSGATKSLYSFSIERGYAGTASSITYRIGASSDLSSSYLVAGTCTVPSGAGFFECVIAEGSRPALTASTVYYLLYRTTSGYGHWDTSMDSANGYAGGNAYWSTVLDWDGLVTDPAYDLTFKIKVCD